MIMKHRERNKNFSTAISIPGWYPGKPLLLYPSFSFKLSFRNGITRYEEIFGKTFVSVGGETTTREFVTMIGLAPDMKVLDIGSGAGGSAFYMARK